MVLDDIILPSVVVNSIIATSCWWPSLRELQRLFSICESELKWLDLCINTKKTCSLCIGPRHDVKCSNIVTSDGLALPWVDEIRYLGIFITRNRRFNCSFANSKRSFYRSVNAIFGKVLSIATVDVILNLINSKCLPVGLLLYGSEVCPVCVNRISMKLFIIFQSWMNVDIFSILHYRLSKRTAKLLHALCHFIWRST